jgi:hypothetical protein
VDVNKFDGSDPMSWVTQMENYLYLHDISDDLAKPHYGFIHLDNECYKCCKMACQGYVAWTQFVKDIYDHFDTKTHHLGCLTKLKQIGTEEEFITSFEKLDFKMEGMADDFIRE